MDPPGPAWIFIVSTSLIPQNKLKRNHPRRRAMQGPLAGEQADPYVQNPQGMRHALGGRLGDAVAYFRVVVALKREFPEARNNLTLALKEQSKLDEAIAGSKAAAALRRTEY